MQLLLGITHMLKGFKVLHMEPTHMQKVALLVQKEIVLILREIVLMQMV